MEDSLILGDKKAYFLSISERIVTVTILLLMITALAFAVVL